MVQVEVWVHDPVRPVEAEGDLDEPIAQGRQQVDALLEEPPDRVEGEAGTVVGLLENHDVADVPVGRGRLHAEEARVHAAQLLHPATPSCSEVLRSPRPGRWAGQVSSILGPRSASVDPGRVEDDRPEGGAYRG